MAREYSATFTKNTSEVTTVTVEANTDEEADAKFAAIVKELVKTPGAHPEVTDNLELEDEDWDYGDVECTANCDEDEEE